MLYIDSDTKRSLNYQPYLVNRRISAINTRWAPTSYKWSYNPYKWPHKWETGVVTLLLGVITPFITNKGPPCRKMTFLLEGMIFRFPAKGGWLAFFPSLWSPQAQKLQDATPWFFPSIGVIIKKGAWNHKVGPKTSYKKGYNSTYKGYNPGYPFIRPFIGAPQLHL